MSEPSTPSTPGLPGPAVIREVRLGGASVLLASGTIISRLLGFLKVVILTAAIGQTGSASADAFALANQLPNSIYALIAGGVLSAVLVPQIVKASRGMDGGAAYVNKIITLGVVLFAAVTLIAVLFAPLLVSIYSQSSSDGVGFSREALTLATTFAYLCLPQIFFYALYSLLSEVLNARNIFGPFTWAPIVNNIVAIAGLFVFMALYGQAQQNTAVDTWDSSKILLLAGTATIGIAAQALVLTLFWKRVGLRFRPDFRWKGVGLSATGKAAGWLFGMVLVTQIAGVFQIRIVGMASGAGASISTLEHSWLIFMLPHSVIAVSIATAYFTRISNHAAQGDLVAVHRDVSSSLRAIGLFLVFSAIALAVLAYPFARIFESEFANVTAMGNVILAFLVGVVPFGAFFIIQRTFYALGQTRTTFYLQCLQSVVFVAAALLCMMLPNIWIAAGVAGATTIAGFVHAIVGVVLLRKRLGGTGGRLLSVRYLQFLWMSMVAGVGGVGLLVVMGGFSASGFAQSGRAEAILTMACVGIFMALIYAGLLAITRNPEFASATKPLWRRIRHQGQE